MKEGRAVPPEPTDAQGRRWCGGNDFSQPGAMGFREAGAIALLMNRIRGFIDRPLVDATGLTGTFEWHFFFSLSQMPALDSPFPALHTAIEEQLGLRLEGRTGPVEVRVIDSIEMPTPD